MRHRRRAPPPRMLQRCTDRVDGEILEVEINPDHAADICETTNHEMDDNTEKDHRRADQHEMDDDTEKDHRRRLTGRDEMVPEGISRPIQPLCRGAERRGEGQPDCKYYAAISVRSRNIILARRICDLF